MKYENVISLKKRLVASPAAAIAQWIALVDALHHLLHLPQINIIHTHFTPTSKADSHSCTCVFYH